MLDHIYAQAYIARMNETEIFFKMLSDTTRLRCLTLLQLKGELCVCELSHALNLSQPMISRHLGLLRDNGLVNAHRSGQWMYYRLNPELSEWTQGVLLTTASANEHTPPFADDLALLANMPNRPDKSCCA